LEFLGWTESRFLDCAITVTEIVLEFLQIPPLLRGLGCEIGEFLALDIGGVLTGVGERGTAAVVALEGGDGGGVGGD
jgi:hypothetical protein